MSIELRTFITYEYPDMLFCMEFSDGSMIWVSEGDCPLGCWPKCDDWYRKTMDRIDITDKAFNTPIKGRTFVETTYDEMNDHQRQHHILHAEEAGQSESLKGWIAEIEVA